MEKGLEWAALYRGTCIEVVAIGHTDGPRQPAGLPIDAHVLCDDVGPWEKRGIFLPFL